MIVQNISETDYNTESLERDMGMTKTVVVSGIKTLYGIAPTELINRIRIQAAEEMQAKPTCIVTDFQNGAFCVPKVAVLHSKSGSFALQKWQFCKTVLRGPLIFPITTA